jgi:putative DNA primase/helicase
MSKLQNLTLDQAGIALSFCDYDDREIWVTMGMALKSEFGEMAFDTWNDWSAQSASYKPKDAKAVWKSIKMHGRTTIGTLINEAKNNGYKYESEKNIISDEDLEKRRIARENAIAESEANTARLNKQAQDHAVKLWSQAKPVTEHPYLAKKQVNAHGLRIGTWEAIDENGKVWATIPNALLIPVKDESRELVSLQAIFADDNNPLKRDKDFIKGGKKSGCYHGFGKPPTDGKRHKIIIGEGYATLASVYEATGAMCVVSFDSGNLPTVAKTIRAKYPDADIVIAADNDHANKKNAGLESARKAAVDINATIALPEHEGNTEITDFNDIHVIKGLWYVKSAIESAFERGSDNDNSIIENDAMIDYSTMPDYDFSGYSDSDFVASDHQPEPEKIEPPKEIEFKPTIQPQFKILGFDGDTIYFMPKESNQIRSISSSGFSENALLSLAPLEYWQATYPLKTGFDKSEAVNWIMRHAYRKGVFNPDRVRGRGCWKEDKRVVIHLGDRLHVDGQYQALSEFESRYIYQSERPFPRFDEVQAMTTDEGAKLLELATMFRWTVPASALLLSGWCFLAPICGALKWRPHIWLSGGAGSGKSTIINEFVYPLMSGMSLFAQGNSTEAGLRQNIKGDAIPVLFEEAEQHTEKERNSMQAVLALIRQSSSESGAKTLKGTAGGTGLTYHIRSMFCLASIQVGIQQQADRERLTVLTLREKDDMKEGESNRWNDIQKGLYEIERDDKISKRIFKRAITMINVIYQSIAVFVEVAAAHFGNQRTGDQYGTLLAGTWCLVNDEAPTIEQAKALINSTDWNDYQDNRKGSDSELALEALLLAKLRSASGIEYTIYELLDAIAYHYNMERTNSNEPVCQLNIGDVNALFARVSMKYDHEERALLIANSSDGVDNLLKNSKFGTDIRGLLLRNKGVRKLSKIKRFSGKSSRSIAIDVAEIVK